MTDYAGAATKVWYEFCKNGKIVGVGNGPMEQVVWYAGLCAHVGTIDRVHILTEKGFREITFGPDGE